MSSRSQAPLFIPIETKVREFEAKLLLALFAAEAGFEAVLGSQAQVQEHMAAREAGIYLEKGVNKLRAKHVDRARALGHKVVSWCEEGLVIFSPEAYTRDRVDAGVLASLDDFYAWGGVQVAALEAAYPEAATHRVHITGNPRFDLLREPFRQRFAPEVAALRREHGEYILVNTNFGLTNNYHGRDFYFIEMMSRQGRIKSAEHEAALTALLDYVHASYEAFRELIPLLSRAFPARRIVLRPHPSEDHQRWRDDTACLPNVAVEHHGAVVPWLMAAGALVHHTCTTAVEGHLLGCPAVAYTPLSREQAHPEHEPELPLVVSRVVHEPEAVIQAVGEALASREAGNPSELAPAAQQRLDEYLAAAEGPFACERVVQRLAELAGTLDPQRKPPPLATRLAWKSQALKLAAKTRVKALLSGSAEADRQAGYLKQKFPGLDLAEVRAAAEGFATVSGRFADIAITPVPSMDACYRLLHEGRSRSG